MPKLYTSLASWFHLLSDPADYAEEAEFARKTLLESSRIPILSVLELGSGGGNNASHLQMSFHMTLVDISPSMLELSRTINPECEHIAADMRSVRLGRTFDAVFVHDAVMYMTTPDDLLACMRTAFEHCKPGGVALFLPDFIRETFRQCVHHGGRDGSGRGLRYLEWTHDPDSSDATYIVDFVYMIREAETPVRVEHDCHLYGLFSRGEWIDLLGQAGFTAKATADPFGREVFIATV